MSACVLRCWKFWRKKLKLAERRLIRRAGRVKFFDAENIACVKSDITKIFEPENFPAKSFYHGRVQFQKHFYPTIGDMNPEEVRCAQLIDANKNVATWIRNVEREPLYSFWLPSHSDKFYPDFVVKLSDGNYAAIEYKGEHLATSSDTEEKKLVGELWERSRGGKFLMATLHDDGRRDLSTQIKDFSRWQKFLKGFFVWKFFT